MFVNLHTLPVGKAMYTIAVTNDPVDTPRDERYIEEYDLVFNTRASVGTLIAYALARPDWPYDDDMRVVGVANQSDAYVMQENWEGIEL